MKRRGIAFFDNSEEEPTEDRESKTNGRSEEAELYPYHPLLKDEEEAFASFDRRFTIGHKYATDRERRRRGIEWQAVPEDEVVLDRRFFTATLSVFAILLAILGFGFAYLHFTEPNTDNVTQSTQPESATTMIKSKI